MTHDPRDNPPTSLSDRACRPQTTRGNGTMGTVATNAAKQISRGEREVKKSAVGNRGHQEAKASAADGANGQEQKPRGQRADNNLAADKTDDL